MRKISIEEMQKINGGFNLSAAMFQQILKFANMFFEIGKALGSALKRSQTGTTCPVSLE